jgi:hypothetical protein
MSAPGTFLTAEWGSLAMLNYEIDPAILTPHVAAVAKVLYNENYVALPMSHRLSGNIVEYRWRHSDVWNYLRVEAAGEPTLGDPVFSRRVHCRALLGLHQTARWRLP